jgi:hypothetical protein
MSSSVKVHANVQGGLERRPRGKSQKAEWETEGEDLAVRQRGLTFDIGLVGERSSFELLVLDMDLEKVMLGIQIG